MKNQYVDVIIPTYNGLPWLISTIESVQLQTYKYLKIYIIDDGSTDDTEKVVKSIKDDRIHYIKKSNGGVSSARNHGIKESKSEFVAFLDSDDLWHKDKIEKQLKIINENPKVGLVYGQHNIIDENSNIIGELKIYNKGKLFDTLLNGNTMAGSASMVLVRRSVLNKVGYFREDLVNGEDWEMWMRISLICEIDYCQDIIAGIRNHSQSAQKNIEKMTDSLVYAYSVMTDEFELNEIQRHHLANYCLYTSSIHYYNLGKFDKSRNTLKLLLKESHRSARDLNNWVPKIHIQNGPFTKIIVTQPLVHAFISVILLPLRLFVRAIRLVKRATKGILRRLKTCINDC